MSIIQSQSTSNPCSIAQYGALEAIQSDQSFLKEINNNLEDKVTLITKLIDRDKRCGIVFISSIDLIHAKSKMFLH